MSFIDSNLDSRNNPHGSAEFLLYGYSKSAKFHSNFYFNHNSYFFCFSQNFQSGYWTSHIWNFIMFTNKTPQQFNSTQVEKNSVFQKLLEQHNILKSQKWIILSSILSLDSYFTVVGLRIPKIVLFQFLISFSRTTNGFSSSNFQFETFLI